MEERFLGPTPPLSLSLYGDWLISTEASPHAPLGRGSWQIAS